MKIKCLIVDDKPLAIDILATYIHKVSYLELIATTTNPVEGLEWVRNQAIDLVFLDIQMPELNGLQFIKIAGKKAGIILTTAYQQYALDGYEHDVIDYLLKPIAFDRFYLATEKARARLQAPLNPRPAEITPQQQLSHTEYLFVKTEHRMHKVDLADILYIESLQNYVSIQLRKERILSLQPLKKMEEQLPAKQFMRIHKSFIIAFRHINYIERNHIVIGETTIPIGDSYREAFLKTIERP